MSEKPLLRPVMADFEEDEDIDWHDRTGSWQPITTVPQSDRIDLWVQIFEFSGELVEDCWWNEDAPIPDWYRRSATGDPELAVPIFGYASHWKPRDVAAGPVDDGGPGLLARDTFDDAMIDTWPSSMRERWETYGRAIEEGRIDRSLTRRGCAPLPERLPKWSDQGRADASCGLQLQLLV